MEVVQAERPIRKAASRQETPLGIVFDMDDTLYLERDYVRSGFRAVAQAVATRQEIPAETLFQWLWAQYEAGVRGNTFDCLREAFPALYATVTVEEMVVTYREHLPSIAPLPGIKALLERLVGCGDKLGLLSDGPWICQRNKLCALGLEEHFQPALFSDAWGRAFWKPHVRGYALFSEQWGLASNRLIYIGDNPRKDFVTPNRLSWLTVRLRLPGQQHAALEPSAREYAPHHEVFDLPSLERLLNDSRSVVRSTS